MISRRVRILHIVNNLNYGGMERIVAELVSRTDSTRFETHVMALDYIGHFGNGLDRSSTLHIAGRMARWSMLYPRTLSRQIETIGPDIVHLHSGVLYKASLAASLANIPRQIYTDHGRPNSDSWINRMIDRRASSRVDVVVAVSDPLRKYLASFIPNPSRIQVVRNGVDTERYAPLSDDGEFRSELGVALDVPLIGSVGRLEPVKGYSVLINAFAKLRSLRTTTTSPVLVLVGDGSEREFLERLALKLGVSDSIYFLGWRSDIERITRAFTLFSMSSHSEGTSVSLLEAMSARLCPVVTDVGGNAAVLGPELKQRLVTPDDPGALALGISAALSDDDARERDARAARDRVLQHFSLESMVRQYETLYSTTTDSRS